LNRGLAAQATTGRPLGAAIVDIGELDEDALIDVLCDQQHLERAHTLDPYNISRDLLRRLPEHFAKALSVFPVEEQDDGKTVLACAVVPNRQGILELEAALRAPVEFRLARRAEVTLALRHGYARLKPTDPSELAIVKPGQGFVEYRPIGELLIDMGAISYQDLVKAVSAAARARKRLGEYLVAEGLIRRDQMEEALARQQLDGPQSPEPISVTQPTMRNVMDPASVAYASTNV